MATLVLSVNTGRPSTYYNQYFEVVGPKHIIAVKLGAFLQAIASGNEKSPSIAISVKELATPASGTFVLSGNLTANDTIVINGVTFTAVASGATGNQFNIGGTAALTIVAAAAAINASATALVVSQVTATATNATTLTITSLNYGVFGNQCTIAKGVDFGTVITVSGARLTAGAVDPTAQTLSF